MAAFAAACLIIFLSLSPASNLEAAGLGGFDVTISWIVSTAGHIGLYMLLAVLVMLGWPRSGWPVAVAIITAGGALELVQLVMPDRWASWLDVLSNASGVALARLCSKPISRFHAA